MGAEGTANSTERVVRSACDARVRRPLRWAATSSYETQNSWQFTGIAANGRPLAAVWVRPGPREKACA